MKNGASYFQNKDCPYFPCHPSDGAFFNCLFCYCPLYALGENCGGNFTYGKDGIKNCSACNIPHSEHGYAYVLSKFGEIKEIAKNRK